MVNVRPGVMVDIIFEGDETKNQIASLQTIIYSIADRRMILPQPTPHVSAEKKGKRLLVTFLETREGVTTRYGFWAKLKMLTNHEITPSQPIPVLVIEKETEPEKYNLRMNYRIKPLMNKGLAVFFQGAPVAIADISVGGVRISAKNVFSFNAHDVITMTIGVDDQKFDVQGRVIRAWSPQSAGGHQHYASIQFLDNQAARESLLSKKIILMERELLAHGVS
jgi:hypothetical protein